MGDNTSSVIPFPRARVTTDDRKHRPGECSHHHIKLDTRGGIVTCRDCGASLTPFWALRMLADQYALAVAEIDRLEDRVSRADARILDLSRDLDQHVETERGRKTAPDAP